MSNKALNSSYFKRKEAHKILFFLIDSVIQRREYECLNIFFEALTYASAVPFFFLQNNSSLTCELFSSYPMRKKKEYKIQ